MQKGNENNKVILNLIQNLQRKVVLQEKQQRRAWKIPIQERDDDTNFTSGLPLTYNGKDAFTLIELLVVVLIIGILAAVALPQYQKAVGKARFAELISFGNAIQKAEEAYYLANGAYTSRMDELSLEVSQNNYSMQLSNSYFIIARNGFAPYYVMYFERHPSTIFQGRKECRVSNNQLNSITRQICAGVTGANEGTGDNYSLWVFQK